MSFVLVGLCVLLGVGGGSLGSSISQGMSMSATLSARRRPGSLVIGTAPMSKSTSEPMNLITDTTTSDTSPPNTGYYYDYYYYFYYYY